mmetsp:Transcript_78025/g.220598  ORF Transcript_78025/g.220598 Transcript_78025/m.220598 type:complete len:377 (+) Transcript_78025:1047-2177(+)
MGATASKRPRWCASQISSYATQRQASGSSLLTTFVRYSLKRAITRACAKTPSSHSLWLQAAETSPRWRTSTFTSPYSLKSSTNSARSTEFPGFPLPSSLARAPGSSQPAAQRSRCSSPKGHEHHSKTTCSSLPKARPIASMMVRSFALRSAGGVFMRTSRRDRHQATTRCPYSRTAGYSSIGMKPWCPVPSTPAMYTILSRGRWLAGSCLSTPPTRHAFVSSPSEALKCVSWRTIHMLISTRSVAIMAGDPKLRSTSVSSLNRSICLPMGVFFETSASLSTNRVAWPSAFHAPAAASPAPPGAARATNLPLTQPPHGSASRSRRLLLASASSTTRTSVPGASSHTSGESRPTLWRTMQALLQAIVPAQPLLASMAA